MSEKNQLIRMVRRSDGTFADVHPSMEEDYSKGGYAREDRPSSVSEVIDQLRTSEELIKTLEADLKTSEELVKKLEADLKAAASANTNSKTVKK